MARSKRDIFLDHFFELANLNLKNHLSRNLPSAQVLSKVGGITVPERRAEQLDKVVKKFSQGFKEQVFNQVKIGVNQMSTIAMQREAKEMEKMGIKIPPAMVKQYAEDFASTFAKRKIDGSTMRQRLSGIVKRVEGDIKGVVRDMRGVSPNVREGRAERVLRLERGEVKQVYMRGEKNSFSAYRSANRLIQSEMGLARREAVTFFGKNIGAEYVKWITRGDKYVCPVCRAYATGTDLASNEQQGLGVYSIDGIPLSHPHCRCRVVVLPVTGMDLMVEAQGSMQQLLNMYGGEALTAEASSEYIKGYFSKRQEMDNILDLSPERKAVRANAYREVIDEKAITGLQQQDRMFYNNVARGQRRVVADLMSAANLKVDSRIVDLVGPENAIRMLLSEGVPKDLAAVRNAFTSATSVRIAESMKVVDSELTTASQFKALSRGAEAAGNRAQARAYRLNMINSINKARREAGQSLGYVDGQERIVKNLLAPNPKMVIRLNSVEDARAFTKLVPLKKFTVSRSANAIVADVKEFRPFIFKGNPVAQAEQKLLDIRAGKFNTAGYRPVGMRREYKLKPKQQAVVRFMKEQERAIINSAPGTGKTVMSFSTITDLVSSGNIKKDVLYITSKGLTGGVVDDYNKFFVDRIGIGNAEELKERAALYADKSKKIKVIGHNGFLNDVKAGRIDFKKFDAVVVDEFQNMGPEGLHALSQANTKYRYGVSGTVAKNAVGDLWGMMKWVDPALFKSKGEFVSLFSEATQKSTFFQDAVYRNINKKMSTRLITQKQLGLDPLDERPISVPLTGKRVKDMRAMESKYNNPRTKASNKTKLRTEMKEYIDGALPEKVEFLPKFLKAHSKEKKIIFVQNKGQADMLEKQLKKQGFNMDRVQRITSGMKEDVDEVKNKFRERGDPAIMIMDATASAGHDLPQAQALLHWSTPSNYNTWLQRTARMYRIGNKKAAVYNFHTGSLEDVMRHDEFVRTSKVFKALSDAESVDETGLLGTFKEELRKKARKV